MTTSDIISLMALCVSILTAFGAFIGWMHSNSRYKTEKRERETSEIKGSLSRISGFIREMDFGDSDIKKRKIHGIVRDELNYGPVSKLSDSLLEEIDDEVYLMTKSFDEKEFLRLQASAEEQLLNIKACGS